jgi:hypothetical protein
MGSGSPQTLSYVPADVAWEFGDSNATFSDLQTAYPTGGYVFDLTGGTMGPATFSFNYDGDAYTNTPQLAAASFSALQGLNAAVPITLDFTPMDVSPNVTPGANNIFFSIVNTSDNMTVFSSPPEFWGEVQPPASLKGLDIPPRRAVFVPWKPSRRPAFGMGNPTFR